MSKKVSTAFGNFDTDSISFISNLVTIENDTLYFQIQFKKGIDLFFYEPKSKEEEVAKDYATLVDIFLNG